MLPHIPSTTWRAQPNIASLCRLYTTEKTKPSAELVVATSNGESSIGSIHYADTTGSKVYDLSGREVINDNAKGVYIKKMNGRMVKVAR